MEDDVPEIRPDLAAAALKSLTLEDGAAAAAAANESSDDEGFMPALIPVTQPQAPARPDGMSEDQWKRQQDRMLLQRMLDFEQPIITDKLLEFLRQEGVLEIFISFITQVDEEDEDRIDPPPPAPTLSGADGEAAAAAAETQRSPRAEPGGPVTEELRRSYRATMLLAGDEPSEPLLTFLGQQAKEAIGALFKVFWPASRGSFHHACRVLDVVLRHHPDPVLECIGKNKRSLERHLGPMLSYVEWPPVAETFVKLVTYPSVAGGAPPTAHQASPGVRWKLWSGLAEWRLLPRLAECVSSASPETTAAHASVCADVLLELVEKLCRDENGELLLQPVGHSTKLVEGLLDMAANASLPQSRRTDAARALAGIVEKAVEDRLVCVMARQMAFAPQTTTVPNRLSSVRDPLHQRLKGRFGDICAILVATEPPKPSAAAAAAAAPAASDAAPMPAAPALGATAPSSESARPLPPRFSVLRYTLIALVADVAERSPEQLDLVPLPLWQLLCNWFFEHRDNNLYQRLFYRLLYCALRSNREVALENALRRCRLVTALADAYERGDPQAANRGFVLQLCNAMRLQAETLPPSSFVRNFLQGHEAWKRFLPVLREVTLREQTHGMGFEVPQASRFGMAEEPRPKPGCGGVASPRGLGDCVGIDHGSRFATSLGFEGEVVWLPDASPAAGAAGGGGAAAAGASGKKKKKKKKKKGGAAGAAGGEGEDEEDTEGGSAATSPEPTENGEAGEDEAGGGGGSSGSDAEPVMNGGAPMRRGSFKAVVEAALGDGRLGDVEAAHVDALLVDEVDVRVDEDSGPDNGNLSDVAGGGEAAGGSRAAAAKRKAKKKKKRGGKGGDSAAFEDVGEGT